VNEPTRVFAPSATSSSSASSDYAGGAGANPSTSDAAPAQSDAQASVPQDAGILRDLILESISDKKGVDAVSLDLRKVPEAVADHFILCNGTSTTQVKAIAEHIDRTVRERLGEHPWHMEGLNNCEWVLIDYVDIVVHIFLPEKRQLYNLEELWSDAPLTHHEV
jgi:ribosome-associated protein